MSAKFARVETDLKEYVEDIGIVGHNISVLQKELSRLPDEREPDKKEKLHEMGKVDLFGRIGGGRGLFYFYSRTSRRTSVIY